MNDHEAYKKVFEKMWADGVGEGDSDRRTVSKQELEEWASGFWNQAIAYDRELCVKTIITADIDVPSFDSLAGKGPHMATRLAIANAVAYHDAVTYFELPDEVPATA